MARAAAHRSRPVWTPVFLVIVLLAFVAAIHQAFRALPTFYSWGDGALLELYTIHAGRAGWALGPYSRFGWHHPGPMLFYAMVPVYRLGGGHALALNAAALAINAISLLAIAWIAVRWARAEMG